MAVGGKTKNNLGRSFKKGNSKKSNILSTISNKSISPKKTDKLALPLHQQNSTSSRQSVDLSDDLESVGGRPGSNTSSKFQEDKSLDLQQTYPN